MPEDNNQNIGSDPRPNPEGAQGSPGINLSKPAFDSIQNNGSQPKQEPTQPMDPISEISDEGPQAPDQQTYFNGNDVGGSRDINIPPNAEMQDNNTLPPKNTSLLKPIIIIVSIILIIAIVTFGVMYYLNSSTTTDNDLDSFFEEDVTEEDAIDIETEDSILEEEQEDESLDSGGATLDVESDGGSVTGGDLEETIETPEPDPVAPDESGAVEANG
jgi:hypothetical protein